MNKLHLLKKLAAFGSGIVGLMAINDLFDYVLYPAVIAWLGPVWGGVVMTTAALLLNYGLVLFYNKTKSDWLGLEWLALQAQEVSATWHGRLLRRLLRQGRWVVITFLSWEDPFKAFVFVRGRMAEGQRFGAREWKIFVGVNLLGNLIWTGMVSAGVEFVKRVIFG